MNFAIPRNNQSELLLYYWKIIDLPSISFHDLMYNISFKLFSLPPDEANFFIKKCLKDNLLIEDNKGKFRLSDSLKRRLEDWQEIRTKTITEKLDSVQKIGKLKSSIEKDQSNLFGVLIKQIVEKGTLNRAATVSSSDFEILEFDYEKGIIRSTVSGSKEDPYIIELDINNKFLKHNCHDFETRRSINKKFCKHLTKLFLWLKDEKKEIEFFLKTIVESIEEWTFTS
ncbi:MAG: hypothetical protein ACXAEX_03145 [Promethearchaeota archaeon]